MENHMENNFREIQKILDSCIAHDYKTKVDALFLKREYLTQVQLKDYLRQEIFRVTENIVAIQQKYRVVRNIIGKALFFNPLFELFRVFDAPFNKANFCIYKSYRFIN